MDAVVKYLLNMLPYMLFVIPFFAFGRQIYRKKVSRKIPVNWYHEAGLLLFAMFMTGLASQTIIPKLEFTAEGVSLMGYGGPSRINLIPCRILFDSLRELSNGNARYVLISLAGNIGIFVPAGLFFSLLWGKNRFRRVVLGGAGISLLIELCQLPMNRATDIDDVILNTLGALCGYFLYRLIRKIAPECTSRFSQQSATKLQKDWEEA